MQESDIKETLNLSRKVLFMNNEILTDELRLANSLSRNFIERYKLEKSNLPYHINVIDSVSPKENAHSKILNYLLKYQNNQGFPIFESFLQHLGFDDIQITRPIFTNEKQRIDLLVADKPGNYALIVENKIHGAADQENQIENYLEKIKNSGFDESHIYVLYLTRSGGTPDASSLKEETKISLGPRYKESSYKFDVLYWLDKVLFPQCQLKDKFLISALEQYIDHLNGMFHFRKIDEAMNNQLYQFLEGELRAQDDNPDSFQLIIDAINNLDTTREYLDNLLKLKCFKYWESAIQKDFESHRFVKVWSDFDDLSDYPKVGILIEINDLIFSILIEVKANPYYGIGRHEATDEIDHNVTTFLTDSNMQTKPNKWWYWLENTTYLEAYDKFKLCVNKVLNLLEDKFPRHQSS